MTDEPSEQAPSRGVPRSPRLPILLEAVLRVGTDLELRSTLQQIIDTATALTEARYGALGVLDAGTGTISELFVTGLSESEQAAIGDLPDGHTGLLGALIEQAEPLRRDDLTDDPRSCGVPPGHPVMHSFLGAPIRVHRKVFGNIYLAEKETGHFTDTDMTLLRVLAAQAGIAIGNARLYESARQRERWIEGAAAVTNRLLTGENASDALMTVAERARILSDASAGVILQPNEEGGMEIVVASTLEDPAGLVGTAIAPGSPSSSSCWAARPSSSTTRRPTRG